MSLAFMTEMLARTVLTSFMDGSSKECVVAKEMEAVDKEHAFQKLDAKGLKETAIAGERCEAQGNGRVCLCFYGNTPSLLGVAISIVSSALASLLCLLKLLKSL